jgi:multicomponent Na+:H+ antiporter subunit B
MKIKTNNVMLHTVTRVVAFLILAFSVYLFFAGHNNPGGGFIAGLMTACGLLLLYLSFDIQTIKKILPFNYAWLIGTGLLFCIGTGIISLLFGDAFLAQYHDYFSVPIFGEIHLATSSLFALGVYLTVVGVTVLSILTIGEDR